MLRKIFAFPLVLLRSFSDALARLSRKLSRRTDSTLGSVAAGGRFERWISNVFSTLLSPFVAFSAWLERLGPRRSGRNFDTDADRKAVQRRLEKQQAKEQRSEALKQSWIAKLLGFAVAPFAFAWTLLKTRDRSLIWWILPVAILLGGLGLVVYQTTFVDKRRIASRYESAVADAINAGNFEQAELFQRKLEQLGVSTDQGEYKRALALATSGDIAAAAEKMQAIATPETPGNPGAHFWLAQNLIDDKLPQYARPDNLLVALQHLKQLKLRVGSLPEVQFVEAIALAKLGRFDEASDAFGDAPRQYLDAAAAKMEVEMARNDATAARAAAVTVQRHLTQLKDEGETLTEAQFQLDVKSAQLLDDANAAALAVQQWYDSNPNSDEARLNAATLKLRKVDQWLEDPTEEGLGTALESLVSASETVPRGRVDLVRRRLDAISRKRTDPIIETLYQETIAAPALSGNSLEFFATAAAVKQEWGLADRLFATAAERDAENSATWNNWAYVIDQAYPERRPEGLKYAETATAMEPNNADYRETRGTLLLNLSRWEEATQQLEIALNGLGNSRPVHVSLAKAYEKLGNKRLADLHRQESER